MALGGRGSQELNTSHGLVIEKACSVPTNGSGKVRGVG